MNVVNVLFVDSNKLSLEDILGSKFLTNDDLFEINKFKVLETKKEKAVSRILIRKHVGDYYVNEFGKPLSDKTFFNVSHSKGVIVFVLGNSPIGIDIEKLRPMNRDLIDYISSKEEKEYITNDISFYGVWTNKESLAKANGTGIRSKIKEIPALPINGKKEFFGKSYITRTIAFEDFIVTVSIESNEQFNVNLVKETI